MFRPCIDLHEGKVKQIVGGSLGGTGLRTNFVSERNAAWYAELYQRAGLTGGHVVMLGPGNESEACAAIAAIERPIMGDEPARQPIHSQNPRVIRQGVSSPQAISTTWPPR